MAGIRHIIGRLLVAALVGALCPLILLVVNYALMAVPPEHFRQVYDVAAADGTLAQTIAFPLAPERRAAPFDGNDCLILKMLSLPRESRLKAAISPRTYDDLETLGP